MIEVITSESFHVVYLNNPNVDKLSVKQEKDIPSGPGEWTKWFVARSHEYMGGLWNLSHSVEKQHALFETDTNFWWPQDYRRKICAGSYLETAWDIVGLPQPYQFGNPLFYPTDEEIDRATKTREAVGGKYLAWIIGGSRVDKIYPYSPQVICRVIKELNIPVLLFGIGVNQFDMAQAIMNDVRRANSSTHGLHIAISPTPGTQSPDGRVADIGGVMDWPTRRSITQVITSDLVVSPDTGLAWAAAMEPMPKIIMVSHASAENITRHWVNTTTLHADPDVVPCWPCHRLHNSMDTCVPFKEEGKTETQVASCMADISAERLIENIKRLWKP